MTENYDLLLENALDAVVGVGHDSMIIYWNKQAEIIFGWSKSEAIGQDMADMIVPERLRKFHRMGMQKFIETGEAHILNQRIEVPAIRRNGEEFPSELTVSAFKQNDHYRFFSFIRDVTERKENENEKLRLLEEAQRAVTARDEFIGICSHELKTPITSLSLQFQVAEKRMERGDHEVLSIDASTKRMALANRQLGRLTRLIDDMLDVSRIAIGKMHFNYGDFDITNLISEVIERLTHQPGPGGPAIQWSHAKPLTMVGDRDRIEQVITNLLTNAVKYGNHNPVSVRLSESDSEVLIEVEDQGLGIAPENLERIFQKFERGISSSDISGMGIGLFIAHTIVLAHQGTLSVTSTLGKGSCFKVSLPREPRSKSA